MRKIGNAYITAALYTAHMTSRRKESMWRRFLFCVAIAVAISITVAALVAPGAQGQEPQPLNASDIAEGMRLYQQKGNCQACPRAGPLPHWGLHNTYSVTLDTTHPHLKFLSSSLKTILNRSSTGNRSA